MGYAARGISSGSLLSWNDVAGSLDLEFAIVFLPGRQLEHVIVRAKRGAEKCRKHATTVAQHDVVTRARQVEELRSVRSRFGRRAHVTIAVGLTVDGLLESFSV